MIQGPQCPALRLDQPDQRALARRHPARDRDRPRGRLPDLLRSQSAAGAVAGCQRRPRRPATGHGQGAGREDQRRRAPLPDRLRRSGRGPRAALARPARAPGGHLGRGRLCLFHPRFRRRDGRLSRSRASIPPAPAMASSPACCTASFDDRRPRATSAPARDLPLRVRRGSARHDRARRDPGAARHDKVRQFNAGLAPEGRPAAAGRLPGSAPP